MDTRGINTNRIEKHLNKNCADKGCSGEKRSCYLVNKKLQLYSALITGGAIFAVSVFFGLLLSGTYYLFSNAAGLVMAETGVGLTNSPPLLSQVTGYMSASQAAHSIAFNDAMIVLFRSVAAGLILALGIGYLEIRRTHRIAGPAHRLCKYMQLAKEGMYSLRIYVRKNDPFEETTDAFNGLMEKLEKRKGTAEAGKEKQDVKIYQKI